MKRLFINVICTILLAAGLQGADQSGRKLVYQEQPEYPLIALRLNLHGTVRIKIWVASDGSVRRTEYVGGHPLLAESALKAVKNWKYQPAAKESALQVELKF